MAIRSTPSAIASCSSGNNRGGDGVYAIVRLLLFLAPTAVIAQEAGVSFEMDPCMMVSHVHTSYAGLFWLATFIFLIVKAVRRKRVHWTVPAALGIAALFYYDARWSLYARCDPSVLPGHAAITAALAIYHLIPAKRTPRTPPGSSPASPA